MNTKHFFLLVAAVSTAVSCMGARNDFNYATATPDKKAAVQVLLPRNPFQAGQEPDRPLPVLKDKDDPVAKLPTVIASRIRAVIREPNAMVMIDAKIFRPGDEIFVGKESPLPKYRVVLKSIGSDRLFFNMTSLDPQLPGQVEGTVPIPNEMK